MARGISRKTKAARGVDRDVPGPKRTADEILRDRAEIARMMHMNMTQTQIAEELSSRRDYKLSQPTISGDIKIVRSEWLKASVDNYDNLKLIELSRLDEEERTVREAWERSKQPKKKERTRTGTNDGKPFEEFTEEVENRDGNPAFLTRLESIRLRRCNILGFEAHQRSQNINAAIDTLIAAGYIVRLPEEPDKESP